MQISTKHFVIRGRSKDGAKSYSLPLSKKDLETFGISESDDPSKIHVVVAVEKGKVIVERINKEMQG